MQDFTIRQRTAQLCQVAHYLFRMGIGDVQQCGGEDIIAHQHADLVVVDSIYRSLSSSLPTLIHHIIVYQTGCVEQFEPDGCMLGHRCHTTKSFGNEQDKHGAHTFASALSDVVERLRQQAILVLQRLVEHRDEFFQFRTYGFFDER